MVEAYALPERTGNPFWPMPPDYGARAEIEVGGCRRCLKRHSPSNKGNYCKECREYRKCCRVTLLHGWYDPGTPDALMRDPDIFLAALNFYVDFYTKKSRQCAHQYALPDCRGKPIMQRMFTRPRSALVSPRNSGKTFSIIYEMGQFIAVCRPNTGLLLGSETKDLTAEKLKEIKRRTEGNVRLYHDLGLVWGVERSSARDWSNTCLDFKNGSYIRGSSIDQATRGRHPMVGMIDDPEGKRSSSGNWRRRFMHWLFKDYLNQFADKGTHVMWIGTILDVDSCLYRAVHNDDPEDRFIAWERRILKMIYEDPPDSGIMVSLWPERLTVDEFERKKRGSAAEDGSITPIGMAATMAEFQGEPIPHGDRMFVREERKHGYVVCDPAGDGTRMIYDPASRVLRSFDELLLEAVKIGAVDPADTPKNTADESALVVAAFDADGILWVLDAWAGRCFYDYAVAHAFTLGHQWKLDRIMWEEAFLGKVAMRDALKKREQRLADGFHVPMFLGISHGGVRKELRIERMKTDWDAGRIKVPLFRPVDGYAPIKSGNRGALQRLIDQFDLQTNEPDPNRHDDLIDAMEMVHRTAARRPGKLQTANPSKRRLEEWELKGIFIHRGDVRPENWTDGMRRDFEEGVLPKREPIGVCDAFS